MEYGWIVDDAIYDLFVVAVLMRGWSKRDKRMRSQVLDGIYEGDNVGLGFLRGKRESR